MKYEIRTSTRFKKDLKRCAKRGLEMKLISFRLVRTLISSGGNIFFRQLTQPSLGV